MRNMLLRVCKKDIGDQWVRPTLRLVLFSEVVPEEFFSLDVLCLSAAKADEARSVSDDPLSAGRVQVEPRTLRFSRHANTIRSRSAGVVQSTRPIRKITRLPRTASARKVAGVQRPARIVAQASLRGIGSSGLTSPPGFRLRLAGPFLDLANELGDGCGEDAIGNHVICDLPDRMQDRAVVALAEHAADLRQ